MHPDFLTDSRQCQAESSTLIAARGFPPKKVRNFRRRVPKRSYRARARRIGPCAEETVTRFTLSLGEYAELRGFLGRYYRNCAGGHAVVVRAHLKSTPTGAVIADLPSVLPALAAVARNRARHDGLEALLRRARMFLISQQARAAAVSAPEPRLPSHPALPTRPPSGRRPKASAVRKPRFLRLMVGRISRDAALLKEIPAEVRADPKKLARELSARWPALATGGRRPGGIGASQRAVPIALYGIYLQSPTLQELTPDLLEDTASLMRFLVTFRDRVAVENWRAEGALRRNAFTVLRAEDIPTITTLIDVLEAVGLLGERANRLRADVARPLDYYFRRRQVIEREVAKAGEGNIMLEALDTALFTRPGDPSRRLSDDEIRDIVTWARWLGREEVPLRSLYGADEIDAMMHAQHSEVLRATPPGIVRRLREAAVLAAAHPAKARTMAVEALAAVVECGDRRAASENVPDVAIERGFARARQLIEWNRDALEERRAGAGEEGGAADVPPGEAVPGCGGALGASLSAMLLLRPGVRAR